jgi:hypothetical protein
MNSTAKKEHPATLDTSELVSARPQTSRLRFATHISVYFLPLRLVVAARALFRQAGYDTVSEVAAFEQHGAGISARADGKAR